MYVLRCETDGGSQGNDMKLKTNGFSLLIEQKAGSTAESEQTGWVCKKSKSHKSELPEESTKDGYDFTEQQD